MHLIEILEVKINEILTKLGYQMEVQLNVSNRPDLGDYQFNGAFNLAKEYKKSPVVIANEIVDKLAGDSDFKQVDNASGFINLTLSDEALVKYLNDIVVTPEINKYIGNKETVLLDYGGANVAKELHVGHLRPANIGEALKRLYKYCGYKTISDVHLGDWGRPMGLIIREIKERMPELPYFDENFNGEYPSECPVTADELNQIYPYASNRAKEDEAYLNDAREITVALQNRHPGYFALWQSFTKISIADINAIYTKLNAQFDLWEGEYSADEFIPIILKRFKDNDMTEVSDGATVINVKEDSDKKEMPPAIVVNSNGGSTYATTDLATLYTRMQRYQLDYIFYITDFRQELHFTQVFRAAYKTGLVPPKTKLEHLGLGTMNGPDGKPFKTRDGGVLSLKGLIALVKEETRKVIKDNIAEADKDGLAEELAIAAIKYADLLPNRASDYIFDPVKFSDLNGKTGPYLLYSTVRMQSLLKKCATEGIVPGDYKSINSSEEREIILNLLKIKSILEKCLIARSLNELAEFLYKLTNSFNAFYGEHEILKEKDHTLQTNWITLTSVVYQTNKTLLDILGISVPDKI